MLRSIKNILIFSTLFTFIFAEAIPLGSSIPLPEIKMEDISGKKVSLNDVKMKMDYLSISHVTPVHGCMHGKIGITN